MTSGTDAPKQATIGPIRLAPGIPRREVFVFLLIAGIASALTAFINLMQPYVFNEIMDIPVDKQGQLAGELMTVQQAVVLICVSFAGALADKIGRKVMLVFALVGFAISALVYPLAGTVFVLFVIRFFFGIASSAHTAGGPPKFYDYPDNASRGKFMAMVMIFYALVAVVLVGAIGGQVPGWLVDAGFTGAQAGQYALWGAAGFGFAAALIAAIFMMDDRPKRGPDALAQKKSVLQAGLASFTELTGAFKEVAGHARTNRRFGILLLTSFVIRTDEAVVASFFALWITIQGAQEGMTAAEALVIAGIVMALMRATSFIVPPILGILLDRYDRLKIYIISLIMVGVSFTSAMLVDSVSGWAIFALAAFIGLTENAQTISQQAFFGQEAPAHLRGTAYGLLAFFGTGSVVVISLIAGYLFDLVGPTAPFVLIGGLHILFSVLALLYLRKGRLLARLAAEQPGSS